MDLHRHLAYFSAVATERHFGHAADELGITQPPLSQGIRRLEQHWGVRLFDRSARGVALTDAGAGLLPGAERLLRDADQLLAEARRLSDSRPVVRLAVVAELDGRLGDLVAAAARTAAGAGVQPEILTTRAAVDGVSAGRLELAAIDHPAVVDGCDAGEVHELPRRLLLPSTSTAERIGRVDVPLACSPRSGHPAAHDQMIDQLRRLGHPGTVRPVESGAEARALVAAGLACALVGGGDAAEGPWRVLPAEELPLRVRVVRRRLASDPELLRRLAGSAEAVLR